MYDSQRNNAEVQEENRAESFDALGSSLAPGLIMRRQGLPEWAINWSKSKFGMDVKGVKLCVVDKQDSDEPFAAAGGSNIFVTPEYKNDKSVLMHEITHIYQQAVGAATESNVGDQSLEDEAVKVSEGGDVRLSKKQKISDEYIIPRQNTNIVQFLCLLGAIGIGILVTGAVIAAGVGLAIFISRNRTCKKIAQEINVPVECVKRVYKYFGWAIKKFGRTDFDELCRVVNDKNITDEKLEVAGRFLGNNYKEDGIHRYVVDLRHENSEPQKAAKEEKPIVDTTQNKVETSTPYGTSEEKVQEPEPVSVTIKGDGNIITKEHTKDLGNATRIVIENGVQEIGRTAFSYLKKLKEVVIPDTVTKIHIGAFFGCKKLENISLPKGLQTIEMKAFQGCGSLKEIEIPSGVTEIPDGAFGFCKSLQKVTLPDGLKSIGINAFSDTGLKEINLPESIEELGEMAFARCNELEKIILPKGLKNMGGDIFDGCVNLREVILNGDITELIPNVFKDCTKLEKVVLPEKLQQLGKDVFRNCSSLK